MGDTEGGGGIGEGAAGTGDGAAAAAAGAVRRGRKTEFCRLNLAAVGAWIF